MRGHREFEMVEVDGVRYVKGEEPEVVVSAEVDVEKVEAKEAPAPRNKARGAASKEA